MNNDLSFLDKQTRANLQKVISMGVDPQVATQRAIQYQRNLANKGSVLTGNLRSNNLFQGGNIVSDIGNSLARPFVKTGQMVGGSAFEVARALASRFGDKQAYAIDPKTGQPKVQNPFLTNETLAQTNTNPLGVVGKQALQSAAVASYGIPVGGSTSFLGKTVAPGAFRGGALVGGLQAASEDSANLESIVRGAALGGVAGKAFEYGGKLLSKSGGGKKVASKLEEVGTNARTGKVRLKAGVGAPAEEKAIKKVMAEYKMFGPPEKRYELLQPTIDKISKKINTELVKNSKPVNLEELFTTFQKKVAPLVKQGNVTYDEAVKGFGEYIKNVTEMDPAAFSNTANLFNLKKDLQAGMESVYKKIENGSSLTPKEKSLKAIRDTFDSTISKLNPEVKKLTMDQSRLYEAPQSLKSQADITPTLRVFGISIPKTPFYKGYDLGATAVQKTGRIAGKVPGVTLPSYMAPAAARLGGVNFGSGLAQLPSQQQASTLGTQEPTMPLPQTQMPQQQSIMDRLTPEFMIQMEMSPLSEDSKAIIRKAYAYKVAAEEAGGKTKSLTEAQQARADATQLIDTAFNQLTAGSINLGPVAGRVEEFKSIFNAGDQETIDFNRTIAALKASIAKARAGTSFTPNEEKLLDMYTPKVGDSYQQVLSKLSALRDFFNSGQQQ